MTKTEIEYLRERDDKTRTKLLNVQSELDDSRMNERELTDALESAKCQLAEAKAGRERLLSAAVHFLYEGCACPEKHEPDYGDRPRILWNEKIDRLQAAIDAARNQEENQCLEDLED